jgi:murein DD-endopeptidase MepM/ murein hydrolase activator NlpD
LFQPSLRAFDGAGAAALSGPYSARALARAKLARSNIDWADVDLVVDLGRDIGSFTWVRGLATLALLCGTAFSFASRPVALPEAVPPALLPEQVAVAAPSVIAPLALGGTTGERAAPTARVQRLAEPPERPRIEVVARLRASDTLSEALRRAGVGAEEATLATDLVAGAIDPRKVKPGTSFDLVLGRRESKAVPRPLDHLAFRAAFDLKLEVARGSDGALKLVRIPIKVDNTPLRVQGRVGGSLYRAARSTGMPAGVVADFIKALGHTLDIQRDVKGSDTFDLVAAHRRAETGETETGKLLYARMNRGGKTVELMRWTVGGKEQFFTADGMSSKKGLMRTPVEGARLTSGFGFRTHPILGYSRLHKGVDFGAPHGAPILAAASGTVQFAGRHGGHGNYIRLAHNKGIATAYAHLSRFAVRSGQQVQQGQVIGYVGSTGMSTGPHLHYEVYVGGKAVDPRSAKFATGTQLAGGELARFRSEMSRLRGIRPTNASAEETKVAEADTAKTRG